MERAEKETGENAATPTLRSQRDGSSNGKIRWRLTETNYTVAFASRCCKENSHIDEFSLHRLSSRIIYRSSFNSPCRPCWVTRALTASNRHHHHPLPLGTHPPAQIATAHHPNPLNAATLTTLPTPKMIPGTSSWPLTSGARGSAAATIRSLLER